MAKNILSTRLRTLVAQGILEIAPASDGSAYQEYILTDKGRALFPVIVGLRQWGKTICLPSKRRIQPWSKATAANRSHA